MQLSPNVLRAISATGTTRLLKGGFWIALPSMALVLFGLQALRGMSRVLELWARDEMFLAISAGAALAPFALLYVVVQLKAIYAPASTAAARALAASQGPLRRIELVEVRRRPSSTLVTRYRVDLELASGKRIELTVPSTGVSDADARQTRMQAEQLIAELR